ncbi:MAG TPA: hypothetical protein VJ914_37090 [Pseudonocardiaceae bacterium]|nr:hypothetical protein [Pseudonocardiaceae bacterium]
MKRTVVGAIAVVTVAAVATMTGFGLASAASALPASPATAPVSSNAQYLQNQAGVVQVLHDQLKAAALNGDVAGTQDAVNKITAELGTLSSPQGRAAMSAGASSTVDKATDLNNQVAQALKQIESGKTPVSTQAATPGDLLPPLPGPLGAIGALLNSLLNTLLSLITGLLGSLPVPVPLPPVPSLPVPVPPVPSLPVAPPKG